MGILKKIDIIIFSGLLIALLLSFPSVADDDDLLYQASVYALVEAGDYEGFISAKEMASHGNLGVGTFDALDGELTQLDGTIYQIKSDGSVSIPDEDILIPFCNTVDFSPEIQETLTGPFNRTVVEEKIISVLPDLNRVYAIRLEGNYSDISFRSVPRQEKPYPPLAEALRGESVFDETNTTGTALGFWFPSWMQGVNYAGYHLHFLNDEKTSGGHILDFTLRDGTVQIDPVSSFIVERPESS